MTLVVEPQYCSYRQRASSALRRDTFFRSICSSARWPASRASPSPPYCIAAVFENSTRPRKGRDTITEQPPPHLSREVSIPVPTPTDVLFPSDHRHIQPFELRLVSRCAPWEP